MSKFLDIWNGTYEGLPQNTEQESLGAQRIRDLKVDLRERLTQDHSWAGDDSDGYHAAVTLLTQTGDPTPTPASGTAGSVYSKVSSTINELFFKDSSGNVLQITKAGTLNVPPGVPTGVMLDFGGVAASAPSGYLGCDGSAVSRTTYAALFTAIGTQWGVGDGSTTFNLPDTRRRATIGSGGTAVSGPANTVGSTGGEEIHLLTNTEIPAHTHGPGSLTGTLDQNVLTLVGAANTVGTGSSASFPGGGANTITVTSGQTGSAGGGGAHNNMQPSAVVLKIIKT